MKNNKKAYLAPMVEVMNARVEKGFAGSGTPSGEGEWGGMNGNRSSISMNIGTLMEDFD